MMDAENAVEAAAYGALNVADVLELADVFQHVPQDYQPAAGKGVLIIGDMDSEAVATKGGNDQRVSLVIAGVIEAEERRPVRALKAKVLEKLNGQIIAVEGWSVQFVFDGADGFLDPETGEAYAGNFRFTAWAFAQA